MTAPDDDDDQLLPLAERIAEGATVVPEEEEQRVHGEGDRTVLKALLDIASIEAAYRSAERSFAEADSGEVFPRHWAHLTILEKIGQGEFGDVYRAHDTRLQIDVALKLSTVDNVRSVDASRILDEARLLAKVRHPNVVRVYGADHQQGRVGLWMDLVGGNTLEELTKTHGFSAGEATHIGVELCRALAAVHSVGVLHGDVKAHNVIRQDGGRIVLVDFGAGRPLSLPRSGGDVVGTPVYFAPEVLAGQPRSVASDVYSLGVLLFHLVTGDYPVYIEQSRGVQRGASIGFSKALARFAPRSAGRFHSGCRACHRDRPAGQVYDRWCDGSRAGDVGDRHRRVPCAAAGSSTVDRAALAGHGSPRGYCGALDRGHPEGSRRYRNPLRSSEAPGGYRATVQFVRIEAAFYRTPPRGSAEERLTPGSRLRLNDQLYLSVQTSAPTYMYVVNEDDMGAAYLLFPLRNHPEANPLPAATQVRLPDGFNWRVDSAGGKEHFLVFASSERLTAFENVFKQLASPRLDDSEASPLLPTDALEQFRGLDILRSVGGLAPARPSVASSVRYRDLFTTPLVGRETATGLWVRQLTVTNPGTQ